MWREACAACGLNTADSTSFRRRRSMSKARPEIPGTVIFDGAQAMKGYALNKMCFSFNDAANRQAFVAARMNWWRRRAHKASSC
jgi:hypothetical protein